MPTVKHPDPKFAGRVANVDFANGEAKTDVPGSLAYFRRHDGYKIDGKPSSGSDDGPKALSDMTKAELKDYAAERDIDLGDATRNDDIRAVIEAAEGDSGDAEDENEES